MEGIVAINGKIVSESEAKISVMDRVFLFGDGIFEVLVGFQGHLLALDEHIDRLWFSAKQICLDLPFTKEELKAEVRRVYKQAQFPKSYVRIGISRGEGPGLRPPQGLSCNVLIYVLPAVSTSPLLYEKGAVLATRQKFSNSRGASIKHPFYLPGILGLLAPENAQCDDIVWVNQDGEITEAITSNIFFVGREGDKVFVETPHLESGLLGGVTRQSVLRILRDRGVECFESSVLKEELARFDEAFLTSTVRGLLPIARIDEKRFTTCRDRSFFKKVEGYFLQDVYSQLAMKVDWDTGEKY